MQHATIIPAEDLEVHHQDWGHVTFFASDTVGPATDQALGRCVIYPGKALPLHYHPACSEVMHVLQGQAEMPIDEAGTTRVFGPGDTVIAPPNLPHLTRNVGENDVVLIIAFSKAERQFIVVEEAGP